MHLARVTNKYRPKAQKSDVFLYINVLKKIKRTKVMIHLPTGLLSRTTLVVTGTCIFLCIDIRLYEPYTRPSLATFLLTPTISLFFISTGCYGRQCCHGKNVYIHVFYSFIICIDITITTRSVLKYSPNPTSRWHIKYIKNIFQPSTVFLSVAEIRAIFSLHDINHKCTVILRKFHFSSL